MDAERVVFEQHLQVWHLSAMGDCTSRPGRLRFGVQRLL